MSATSEASVTEEASVLQEKSQMGDSQSGMILRQRISYSSTSDFQPRNRIRTDGSHYISYSKQQCNMMGCQIGCVSPYLFMVREVMPPMFIKVSRKGKTAS